MHDEHGCHIAVVWQGLSYPNLPALIVLGSVSSVMAMSETVWKADSLGNTTSYHSNSKATT